MILKHTKFQISKFVNFNSAIQRNFSKKIICSDNFNFQNKIKNPQLIKNDLSKKQYTRKTIETILEQKFNSLYQKPEDYKNTEYLEKFLTWVVYFIGLKTPVQTSFLFFDKIFTKEFSNSFIQNSDHTKIMNLFGKIHYRNSNLMDAFLDNIVLNPNKLLKLDVGLVLSFLSYCEYHSNDELLCEFLCKYVLVRKGTLNYNNIFLSAQSLSKFKHLPTYLWRDIEQHFLLVIKRLFKPISLYRVVDSFHKVSVNHGLEFSNIWNVSANYIENNQDFLSGPESLSFMIILTINKYHKLSEYFEKRVDAFLDKTSEYYAISKINSLLSEERKQKINKRFLQHLESFSAPWDCSRIANYLKNFTSEALYSENFLNNLIVNNPFFDIELYSYSYSKYCDFLKSLLYLCNQNSKCLKLISEIDLSLKERRSNEKLISIIYFLNTPHYIQNRNPNFETALAEKLEVFSNRIVKVNDLEEINLLLTMLPFMKNKTYSHRIIEKIIPLFKFQTQDLDHILIDILVNNHNNIQQEVKITFDIDQMKYLKTIKSVLDLSYSQINEHYSIICTSKKLSSMINL